LYENIKQRIATTNDAATGVGHIEAWEQKICSEPESKSQSAGAGK
jgi:hypothetical protein